MTVDRHRCTMFHKPQRCTMLHTLMYNVGEIFQKEVQFIPHNVVQRCVTSLYNDVENQEELLTFWSNSQRCTTLWSHNVVQRWRLYTDG
jgi:hypothetical protein